MNAIVFTVTVLIISLFSPCLALASSASDTLSKIPVQHGGRVKPFVSFAQEAVLYVTGKSKFEGMDPVRLVWHWMAEPEKWNGRPMIPVSLPELREEFSPMLIRGRLAPQMVHHHTAFLEKVRQALAARERKEKLPLADERRIEIYERAQFFREIGEGTLPAWLAHPEDPRLGWFSFQSMTVAGEGPSGLFSEDLLFQWKRALSELLGAWREGPASGRTERAAAAFRDSLRDLFYSRGIALDEDILGKEVLYHRLRPFDWAWKFYLASAVLLVLTSVVGAGFPRPILKQGAATAPLLFLAAFALHSYGFFLRCSIAGRPPVTNMYESIIWVSWAVVLFSILLYAFHRAALIPATASWVAALALLLAQGLPLILDPAISPLVPVLRSNLWLTVHVLTITLSYGAFALAWGLGHVVVFRFAFWPSDGVGVNLCVRPQGGHAGPPLQLSQYLYRALQIGVILLAAGTVLGGVWASFSWGRFWGWDPKETWALIALLGYLTVLHGRVAGWLGPFGMAVGSVVAFLGVLMAWYGVNFVLAAGLHSYGFGGGGAPYVAAAVTLDVLLVVGAAWIYQRKMHGVKI